MDRLASSADTSGNRTPIWFSLTIALIPGVLGSSWAIRTSNLGVASIGYDRLDKKNIGNEETVTSWKACSRVRKKLLKDSAKPATETMNNAPTSNNPTRLPARG